MAATEDDIRDFVLKRFESPLRKLGLTPAAVPDDFDLLDRGVIDSFGLIELVVEVSEEFELELDFDDLDPEGLTKVGPFSRYVAERSQ